MKKIFFIICCTLLFSCVEYPTYKTVDGRVVEINSYIDNCIKYIEYDGHEYVFFQSGHGKALCHSPKCPCLEYYKK